jgi:hypothetical protein
MCPMAMYEAEFYRRGLSHSNRVVWALVFNSDTGVLKVRTSRTSQSAYKYDQEWSPSAFLAKGSFPARTIFQKKFADLLKSVGMKEIVDADRT